jgi:hypothetical protein
MPTLHRRLRPDYHHFSLNPTREKVEKEPREAVEFHLEGCDSNLRYRHEQAREYPAWTLDDVLLLPVVNPHRRSNCTTDATEERLSVFNHYLKAFASEMTADEQLRQMRMLFALT